MLKANLCSKVNFSSCIDYESFDCIFLFLNPFGYSVSSLSQSFNQVIFCTSCQADICCIHCNLLLVQKTLCSVHKNCLVVIIIIIKE